MAEATDPQSETHSVTATATTIVTASVTADLVQGLETLLGLLGNARETLDQLVTLIEGRLSARSIDEEVWVPIPGAQPTDESGRGDDTGSSADEPMAEERTFGGVTVTIMKMGTPAARQAPATGTTKEYQLGYGQFGETRTFLIRTAHRVNGPADVTYSGFSDPTPLRLAPFDVRLEGIREIATLAALIEARTSAEEADDAAGFDQDSKLPHTE